MYTLTLIRLSLNELKFENTEINNFQLAEDIEKELGNNNASFDQVEKFLNLKKGESTTIEVQDEINNKTWIYYIHKF